jgi:acyl carrier protein
MKDELRTFIVDALREMNYDVSEVTDDTELGPAGLDLESLALAELAVRLEDSYQLKFSDDDMETLALMTLDEFTTVLADRLAAAPAEAVPADAATVADAVTADAASTADSSV